MKIDYEKRICNNICKYRKLNNFTQEEFSARLQTLGCSITRSALAKIEVGKRHLHINEFFVIKEVLGVSFDDLIS